MHLLVGVVFSWTIARVLAVKVSLVLILAGSQAFQWSSVLISLLMSPIQLQVM